MCVVFTLYVRFQELYCLSRAAFSWDELALTAPMECISVQTKFSIQPQCDIIAAKAVNVLDSPRQWSASLIYQYTPEEPLRGPVPGEHTYCNRNHPARLLRVFSLPAIWKMLKSINIWLCMITSSNGNIICVTGPLCREFTGHRWIPLTKASDSELWYFLWSAHE